MSWTTAWRAKGFELIVQHSVSQGRTWHRVCVNGGVAGAVIMAVDPQGRICLIRQRRPVTGETLWEFPRGFGDATDATVEATAAREFLEETGVVADGLRVIGNIWADSGLLANPIAVAVAQADGLPQQGTDGEGEQVIWVDANRLREMVANGEVNDGISLAALACCWAKEVDIARC